jgi:hypothetical protein
VFGTDLAYSPDAFFNKSQGNSMLAINTKTSTTSLLRNRNRTVAKSFYRQLKTEGFSHEQIIDLSATLLDLVTDDMKDRVTVS